MYIKKSTLYLFLLFIEGIIIISLSKYFLPEKYFYDSNTILSYFNYRGPLISFDSYLNTARFYKLFGFEHFPSNLFAGLFNYILFFFFIIKIIRITNSRISDLLFIFMLTWNIPVSIYLGQFSKEIVSLIVIGIQLLLIHYKVRYYKTLIILLILIYGILFREYWIIIIYFTLILYLVFNKGIDINKKVFLKIGKVSSFLLFYSGVFILFLAVTYILNRYLTDARTLVNVDRLNSADAVTIIQNTFINTNFITDMLNWLIGWLQLLFPFNLFFVSSYSSLLFMIWNIINIFVFIYIFKKTRSYMIKNKEISWSLAWVISFSLVQGMFEPDYGSYFKHEISILPYFLYIYLIYRKKRNLVVKGNHLHEENFDYNGSDGRRGTQTYYRHC